MKSMPLPAGNINMRGKRTLPLNCGCCVCRDLRGKEAARLAMQEIIIAKTRRNPTSRSVVTATIHPPQPTEGNLT